MPQTPDPEATALFRYGLIAEFIHLPAGHKTLHALLRAKAAQDYTIPGTTRCRIAPETLRHWLKAWRAAALTRCAPSPGPTAAARVRCMWRWPTRCSA